MANFRQRVLATAPRPRTHGIATIGTFRRHEYARAPAIVAPDRGNCADSAANRAVGGARRKPRAIRLALACSRSGFILPIHGISLDHSSQAVDPLVANRTVARATLSVASAAVELGVLG